MYRTLLRLSRTWEAKEPVDTKTERNYIVEETKRLFRVNINATEKNAIEHVREVEARLAMATHYRSEEKITVVFIQVFNVAQRFRNPYPRPVNLPKTSYATKEGKKTGKAIDKLNKISKPIYVKSINDTN
jgi:hypothetical protein